MTDDLDLLDVAPEREPEPVPDELPAVVVPRSYVHVTKALYERAWAMQPTTLRFIADLLHFRGAGGAFSAEQLEERLAAARAANGDRAGGAIVGSVAVLPVYGMISQRQSIMSQTSGGTSVDELRNALRSAVADRSISAIVLDVDSPGGSVDGVPELAADIRSARETKPIVAQVNTLAASAAYWLASQASEVVMTPSGEVGSIGVYAMHEDVSRAADMAGVKTTFISAGPYKVEGNSYEPLTDEARSAIQEQVDTYYAMFLADVAKGRGVTVDTVAADYGGGRVFLAAKALAAGMVDRVATLEATVSRLQPRQAPASASRAALAPVQIAASTTRPDPRWNGRMKGARRR